MLCKNSGVIPSPRRFITKVEHWFRTGEDSNMNILDHEGWANSSICSELLTALIEISKQCYFHTAEHTRIFVVVTNRLVNFMFVYTSQPIPPNYLLCWHNIRRMWICWCQFRKATRRRKKIAHLLLRLTVENGVVQNWENAVIYQILCAIRLYNGRSLKLCKHQNPSSSLKKVVYKWGRRQQPVRTAK